MNAARDQGIQTSAVLTSMDTPIGMAIGNSLEVIETITTLRGNGPVDLVELVVVEGAQLLQAIGRVADNEAARKMVADTLKNGSALQHFEKMLIQQNVDPDAAHQLCFGDEQQVLGRAKHLTPLIASQSGNIINLI